MEILLSYVEVALAANVGFRRQLEALRNNLPDRYGAEREDGWGVHIEGACGEMAVAKALGIYWEATVNTFRTGGDVGPYQVRTRSEDWYDLLVRPDAVDDAVYILVTGKVPRLTVRGWITAGQAKQPQWLKGHGGRPPAYFVPQKALRPIDELRASHREALPAST